MARYVIANRRTGLHAEADKVRSRFAVGTTLDGLASASILQDFDPPDVTARRVVVIDADPAEIAQTQLPGDVIIEPEILHYPVITPPRDLVDAMAAPATAATPMGAYSLDVRGAGAALAGAKITLHLRGLGGVVKLEGSTDDAGQARFDLPPGYAPAVALIQPNGGFWTMVVRGPQLNAPIDCPALPADGPRSWWRDVLGQGAYDPASGAGIRVGVADTGLGRHPALAHAVPVGAFINGGVELGAEAALDVNAHGTHVAGIIGARPTVAGAYAGVAPGVDLYAARVFARGHGANQADIATAIDVLSRDRAADLINLSLGSPVPSEILHEAILDAEERGTLCVAAAGNTSGAVNWPAAFAEVVAVGALGLEGWGAPGSLTASRLPSSATLFGRDGFYIANFSCFGPELDCAGPGVGIISTLPSPEGDPGVYGEMDGTSMASPAVCGALAVLLARNAAYLGLPRNTLRTTAARQVLNTALTHLGVASLYQGGGVPSV